MVDGPIATLKAWYPQGRLPGGRLSVRGLASQEEMQPGLVDRPRGTGDWLLMCFPTQTMLRIDGRQQSVAGPVLVTWSPDQGHWYGWPQARWRHSWVHASGAALDALAGVVDLPHGVPIFGFDPTIIDRCVIAVHQEMTRSQPDAQMALLHLEILVREAARCARPQAGSIPPRWTEIRRYIDERFAQRLTLAGLARLFDLSPQHLCEGFRRWFDVPPIEYLIRLRLDRARALLSDRNRSVAEVAAEVGWHDAPHFSRLFRQRCGVTPGQLRRDQPA